MVSTGLVSSFYNFRFKIPSRRLGGGSVIFWVGLFVWGLLSVLFAAGILKPVRRSRQTLGIYLLLIFIISLWESYRNNACFGEVLLFLGFFWVGLVLGWPILRDSWYFEWPESNNRPEDEPFNSNDM